MEEVRRAVVLTALHGFLGLPADWDFLREAGFEVMSPRLDAIPPEGDVLLGYSLGGRLALRALLEGARYRRAVIVSAGLGLEDRVAREERRRLDDRWARKFERDPWKRLMQEWNAQTVFSGHVIHRREEDFDRHELARQLREWSPAVLPAVTWRLHEIKIPVLWIAGDRDEKYANEGRKAVSMLPHGDFWLCPDAGHRAPWENPAAFIARLHAL